MTNLKTYLKEYKISEGVYKCPDCPARRTWGELNKHCICNETKMLDLKGIIKSYKNARRQEWQDILSDARWCDW